MLISDITYRGLISIEDRHHYDNWDKRNEDIGDIVVSSLLIMVRDIESISRDVIVLERHWINLKRCNDVR